MKHYKDLKIEELIKALDERKSTFLKEASTEMRELSNTVEITSSSRLYIKVNLENWTSEERRLICQNCLTGILYFSKYYNGGKSFAAGAYNSVLGVLRNKNNFIWVHKKSVKWSDPEIIKRIAEQGFDMQQLLFEI